MNLHDYINVRRVFRVMAAEWKCPVWIVKATIHKIINSCWQQAMSNPEEKALWDKYFPNGKPTPYQYILRLGRAHETGEDMPFLFKD